ncbi:MAG: molybdopterin-dependent oxidoreductase [Paracoccaceae bacterium]
MSDRARLVDGVMLKGLGAMGDFVSRIPFGKGIVLVGYAAVMAVPLGYTSFAVAETAPLPIPSGEVVLEVTGDLAITNGDGMARFDREMLLGLPPVTIRTTTLWTVGVQEFTGVSLRTLLDRLGAKGAVIDAYAINDYWVDIPMGDAVEGGPMLAYAQNGTALTVRDKGPIWIVYPYDSKSEYQSEVIYSRSVWQLQRLEIMP